MQELCLRLGSCSEPKFKLLGIVKEDEAVHIHNMVRISIVLYPTLSDLVDQLPFAVGRNTLQSEIDVLFENVSKSIIIAHLIIQDSVEDSPDSSASPTINIGDERELDTIAFGNVAQIVLGPSRYQITSEIFGRVQFLREVYIDNLAFLP